MIADLIIEYNNCDPFVFEIQGTKIILSVAFALFLTPRRIITVRQLLSLLWAAPDAFINYFAWTTEQLTQFENKLITILMSVLPSEMLIKPVPLNYSFGANINIKNEKA